MSLLVERGRRLWIGWRGRPTRAVRAAGATPARVTYALTAAVFCFAFLYRYNALGGSLGGFDGDHFMYYVGTQHIALGERPLRDFADGGLQGAWPALTYELPALAQRLGGPTLLSEAILTVGAVAFALTLLFRSAAGVAGVVPALVVTILSLFAGAKLYGFHKVLVFSVAVALLLRYARQPTTVRAALLAAWSAVAFLFRHDYLVYLAPAVALLMLALPSRTWNEKSKRLLVYGGLTTLLLLGPLYSIQRYVGLEQYLQSNLALTGNESRRTDLEWPEFEAASGGVRTFFDDEQNASTWLYYLCLAIPVLALLAIALEPSLPGLGVAESRAFLLSLVLLAFLINHYLLRGNLPARFGDLGAPIAVLAAWLAALPRVARWPVRILLRLGVAAVLVVSTLSVSAVGSVWRELDTTGLRDSFEKTSRRFLAVTNELRALPPPPAGGPASDTPNAVDYLRACTRPEDRVLVVADSAEVAVFAARPFAGGQPTFRPGFYTLSADQALMLRRLHGQSVPVVLTDEEEDYEDNFASGFPQIDAYIKANYDLVGRLTALTGGPMRIFVQRGLVPTSTYRDTGLPCFLNN